MAPSIFDYIKEIRGFRRMENREYTAKSSINQILDDIDDKLKNGDIEGVASYVLALITKVISGIFHRDSDYLTQMYMEIGKFLDKMAPYPNVPREVLIELKAIFNMLKMVSATFIYHTPPKYEHHI